MRLWLLPVLAVFALAACEGGDLAQFWRPISEPNMFLPIGKEQIKLDFDLGQCRCGIYPANAAHEDIVQFQPDKQRLAQTGVTVTPDDAGECMVRPSLVVTECMRQRGWEPTNCSGRMPWASGGALCAGYVLDNDR